jgi:hypothetical protein
MGKTDKINPRGLKDPWGFISARQMIAGFFICLAGLLMASLFAPTISNGLAAAPTRTLTPTPTRTPLVTALKKQLFFGGLGGGGGSLCWKEDPPTGATIEVMPWHQMGYWHYPVLPDYQAGLCIYGIPFERGLQIKLYRPDGSLAGEGRYRLGKALGGSKNWYLEKVNPAVNPEAGEVFYLQDTPVIDLALSLPPGIPAGNYQIEFQAVEKTVKQTITLPPLPYPPTVQLMEVPEVASPKANPLENATINYNGVRENVTCYPTTTNEELDLYGKAFSPGVSTPVGVYRFSRQGYSLVDQKLIRADRKGEWVLQYDVPANQPPGAYWFIAVLDTQSDDIGIGPGACYTIEKWQPCQANYASSLQVGNRVIIGSMPQKEARLRAKPNRDAAGAGGSNRITPGENVSVVGGPTCNNHWIWWQVRKSDGTQGWLPEGDGKEVWLKLVED